MGPKMGEPRPVAAVLDRVSALGLAPNVSQCIREAIAAKRAEIAARERLAGQQARLGAIPPIASAGAGSGGVPSEIAGAGADTRSAAHPAQEKSMLSTHAWEPGQLMVLKGGNWVATEANTSVTKGLGDLAADSRRGHRDGLGDVSRSRSERPASSSRRVTTGRWAR